MVVNLRDGTGTLDGRVRTVIDTGQGSTGQGSGQGSGQEGGN
jgi:hypothetical protein